MTELDYLVIGHVTRDVVGNSSFRMGGTVSYAARTARACGCRVGVVTSAGPDLDMAAVLDGVCVAHMPARETTTFENRYFGPVRMQLLHAVAEVLQPEAVPPDWRASIMHIGPVAQECPQALLGVVGNAFLGLTPQGWMRAWDPAGRVYYRDWPSPEAWLERADAVVLSETDVPEPALLLRYAARTRVLVITRGAAGCTVVADGVARDFPAPRVEEVDPTSAGDIFAAAFFIWMQAHGDPWGAARFANCVAANSVTRVGIDGAPSVEEATRCRRAAAAMS